VPLTLAEVYHLGSLARTLQVPPPDIIHSETVGFIMQARPCTFLNKNNLCRIYTDRPVHCRAFPTDLLEWCALSWKRFGAAEKLLSPLPHGRRSE